MFSDTETWVALGWATLAGVVQLSAYLAYFEYRATWKGRQVWRGWRWVEGPLEARARERRRQMKADGLIKEGDATTAHYPRLGTSELTGVFERLLFAFVFVASVQAVVPIIALWIAAKTAVGWSEVMARDPELRLRGVLGLWVSAMSASAGVLAGWMLDQAWSLSRPATVLWVLVLIGIGIVAALAVRRHRIKPDEEQRTPTSAVRPAAPPARPSADHVEVRVSSAVEYFLFGFLVLFGIGASEVRVGIPTPVSESLATLPSWWGYPALIGAVTIAVLGFGALARRLRQPPNEGRRLWSRFSILVSLLLTLYVLYVVVATGVAVNNVTYISLFGILSFVGSVKIISICWLWLDERITSLERSPGAQNVLVQLRSLGFITAIIGAITHLGANGIVTLPFTLIGVIGYVAYTSWSLVRMLRIR